MAIFMQFTTFPVFCHQSISFHLKSQKFAFLEGEGTYANFLSFSTFWIPFTPNWLKMTHNGKFCQKKSVRLAQNSQFWSICRFSPIISQNSLSFLTFPIPFTPNWLKMTHNAKFCQKSGLDWLKMVVH